MDEQLSEMAAERDDIKAKVEVLDKRIGEAKQVVATLQQERSELALRHDDIGRNAIRIIRRGLTGKKVFVNGHCDYFAGTMIETWRHLCVIRSDAGEELVFDLEDVESEEDVQAKQKAFVERPCAVTVGCDPDIPF
jgi:hypothetical protein